MKFKDLRNRSALSVADGDTQCNTACNATDREWDEYEKFMRYKIGYTVFQINSWLMYGVTIYLAILGRSLVGFIVVFLAWAVLQLLFDISVILKDIYDRRNGFLNELVIDFDRMACVLIFFFLFGSDKSSNLMVKELLSAAAALWVLTIAIAWIRKHRREKGREES